MLDAGCWILDSGCWMLDPRWSLMLVSWLIAGELVFLLTDDCAGGGWYD
jgi:hypothetical protein